MSTFAFAVVLTASSSAPVRDCHRDYLEYNVRFYGMNAEHAKANVRNIEGTVEMLERGIALDKQMVNTQLGDKLTPARRKEYFDRIAAYTAELEYKRPEVPHRRRLLAEEQATLSWYQAKLSRVVPPKPLTRKP